jgi:phosphonate transport system substrate-binding protein
MLTLRWIAGIAGLSAALLASNLASKAETTELNFGIISTEASANQKRNWGPFLEAMSKALGIKINGFYATDYAGVIEAMRFNKVQVAWYGNKSGMEAVDRSNGQVFAQVVSRDGSEGYYSHIIVSASSPYRTLEDILKCDKTLDFGIGDPNSTSGFLVPVSYIFAARGIDPKSCFKTVRNGSHEVNAMAIANNQVHAATTNSEDLQRLEARNSEARSKIRVIWTSPIIPLDPIVWRKDLDPEVKAKLSTFILSYGRLGSEDEIKQAREILSNLIWSPLKPSSDDQLLPIRKLEANKALLKLQADDQLSAEEKVKQIEALRAQIAALEDREKQAASSPFRSQVTAFLEAGKAGRRDDVRRMIAEFASSLARVN